MFKRDRGRSCRKAGVLLAIVTALIAAATSAPAGVASSSGGARGAAAPKGLISLGSKVLASAPVQASTGPWLVWNHATCDYRSRRTHPAAYKADLRQVTGKPTKIGYMYYGDTDPFGVANSKNIKKMAAHAGFKLDVYNLKYPSETEPLTQAHNAVLKKDIGVIQAQQLDGARYAFLDIIQKKGCIPTVQMYLRRPNVPVFGAVWPDAARRRARGSRSRPRRRAGSRPTRRSSSAPTRTSARASTSCSTRRRRRSSRRLRDPEEEHLQVICKYSQTQSARRT